MRPGAAPTRIAAPLALLLAGALAALAAAGPAPTSVFDLPAATRDLADALRIADTDPAGAAARLGALAARHPDLPDAPAALGLVHAAGGATEAALAALATALDRGFAQLPALARDPRLRAVAARPEFDALLLRSRLAPPPPPAALRPARPATIVPEGPTAPVGEANTEWDSATDTLRCRFAVPPALARRPVIGRPPADGPLAAIAPFLNRWYLEGRAAGNAGDLYDNRDRDHSDLRRGLFAQLAFVEYDAAARARGLDHGPQRQFAFDRIVFGNSSTALTSGPYWRGQTRRMLTEPGGPGRLFAQYAGNALYVYPANADHGPPHGDVAPANTPYAITAEGASGSDRPFLEAIALALAALPPAVKETARARGHVAPLLQRLLRRTMRGIETEADYLSGRAHPAVFDGAAIDPVRLVKAAQALTPGTIPPVVRLTVLTETAALPGRDHFAAGLGEAFFDTPSAVARVFRGAGRDRRMLLGAARVPADGGRIVWRLLRGDPDRVRIEPQAEDGSRVAITVSWHEPLPVPGRPGLSSQRVDIAAFAETAGGHSAPAFVSVLFPPDERRVYDGEGRILEIDHADPGRSARYADPLLFPRRDWRDVYARDEAGRALGWTRHRPGAAPADYTAEGHRVLARDAAGRPTIAEAVRYDLGPPARDGRMSVLETPTGIRLAYVYRDAADRIGRAVPAAD